MKSVLIYLLSILLIFSQNFACDAKTNKPVRNQLNHLVDKIMSKMTTEEKIGQVLMPAVPGKSITPEAKYMIQKYKPGGIIFFGFNISSASTIKKFTTDLQRHAIAAGTVPMFISIDQEGGRVYRVKDGATLFPGNMAAGMADDSNLVYKWGRILGLQLRVLGINMNLAPVLDINNNPSNPVINSRSFGSDVQLVARLGVNYVKGLQQSHCIAVGKHFPGHGDTNKDSHKTLPVINYDLDRLAQIEFVPFQKAIDNGLDGIMTAHIAYPKILGNMLPATVSRLFLHDVLRKKMNFNGLVITDDLEMQAISKRQDIGSAAVGSIIAGVDIVLISTYTKNLPAIYQSVLYAVNTKKLSMKRLDEAVHKIIKIKLKYNIIQFENGTVLYRNYQPTKDEFNILKEANTVNQQLSRKSIYYHGEKSLLVERNNKKYVLVSYYQGLRSIAQKAGFSTYSSFNSFYRMNINSDGKEVVLFAHFSRRDRYTARQVVNYCKAHNIKLIAVSTDNPFLLVEMAKFDSMMFSFSNTPESIRQLGLCITGHFEPKYNSSLQLGL